MQHNCAQLHNFLSVPAILLIACLQVMGAALAKVIECMPTMVIIITYSVLARFVNIQVHTESMKPLSPEDAERLMLLISPQTCQESAAMLARQCANIPYALRLVGDSISDFTTAEVPLPLQLREMLCNASECFVQSRLAQIWVRMDILTSCTELHALLCLCLLQTALFCCDYGNIDTL